jgi:WD40 repeat protein/serine/threonine protein kinase
MPEIFSALTSDEDLVRRLPLPLAQLYRRAHNAKTPLEQHLTAFYLWEAALKLLASVAVVEYAERPEHDPKLADKLQNLARPSLGHWWEFVRLLVPALADGGDVDLGKVRDGLLGRARGDLPRAAGLDAALREAIGEGAGARGTVRVGELFDRMVRYRNREVGHGAAGQRAADFYNRMGSAMLAGVAELLGRLDVLAGRRLVYVADVRRQAAGAWLVERYELIGESMRRIESLVVPAADAARLPHPERVYLEAASAAGPALRSLHPLLVYDADAGQVLYLNSRRGKQRTEYLCYTTGHVLERAELAGEQRELLARVLNLPIDTEQVEQWAARSQAEDPTTEEAAGTGLRTLDEFELLSELGRGGMGVVYRAWQPSLGRHVALKSLLRAGDAKAEARFAREIRALGRVEHPNLIKVFTSGVDGDRWFYAMELVEGATLATVCERLHAGGSRAATLDLTTWQQAVSRVCEEARKAEKPLSTGDDRVAGADRSDAPDSVAGVSQTQPRPPAAADRSYVRRLAELMRQAAEAANALHEAGVIHRDIKPGNIIVSADGGQAVLMDLGLAQLADDVEGKLTRTRQFVGTLRYASPEQVLSAGGLDRRSDVYSLGATLWELLTLRPLYGATEQTATVDLMRRIQVSDPEPVRKHNPAVPRDLEAVVLRCLEKDPAKRYQTGRELADDLGRFLRGEPVRARPVSGLERGWRWVRRRPGVAALLGVSAVAALALVAVAVGGYYTTQLERQKEIVEDQKGELDAERQQLVRQEYFEDMNLAMQSWDHAHAARTLELLARHGSPPAGAVDLRGPEWDYLWRLSHPVGVRDFPGFKNRIHSVGYSRDGSRLALACWDNLVHVWDPAAGKELFKLAGHNDFVSQAAFSPDGKYLVSASKDRTVKVWNLQTQKVERTLTGHTHWVFAVAFSPDGNYVASAAWDFTVRLWDLRKEKEPEVFQRRHTAEAFAVAFSPDGKYLASGGGDKVIRVWDAKTGDEVHVFRGHRREVFGVAFSPDGKRLASASWDRTVRLWDVAKGQELNPGAVAEHESLVHGVAFSADGKYLASAGEDKVVKVWDAETKEELVALKGHTHRVYSVAFGPGGAQLAASGGSAGGDGELKVWNWQQLRRSAARMQHSSWVGSLAFSPDGKHLASGGAGPWAADKGRTAGGEVKVWDTAGGRLLLTFPDVPGEINGLAYSPDGTRLAGALQGGTVRVWDAGTGKEVCPLASKPKLSFTSVAFSRDGKHLAAGQEKVVLVWDAATWRAERTFTSPEGRINTVAFSSDGKWLAAAGATGGHLYLWDAGGGGGPLVLVGHVGSINTVAFSPDGTRLASAGGDQTLRLWDPATGKQLAVRTGHEIYLTGLAWSHDGTRLATCSLDRTVKLWDTATGQEALTIEGDTDRPIGVAWSPDGRYLAAAYGERNYPQLHGEVKWWDVSPAAGRAAP